MRENCNMRDLKM